jgi:hypothetical protein
LGETGSGTEVAITRSMGTETFPRVKPARLALAVLALLLAAVVLLATG